MATTGAVSVTFNKMADGTYQFGFDPVQLTTLTAASRGTQYTVTLQLTSNMPDAEFNSFLLTRSPGPAGLMAGGHGTKTFVVTFTNDGALVLDYEVSVTADGKRFTSTDPEVDIPPPS
ncbi:MAG TPA: hypothetical protein VGQ36_17785 [Thermoanaerobaculia bacterium]|nr:hypothetical protein [Thermoanaerobaculia bacterium]